MSGRDVLIVDSGEVGWAAVRAALQQRGDVCVIGEARTYDAALHSAAKHRIDLLLASDRLEGMSSYATLADLRASSCRTSLIALFVNRLEPDELERFGELELAACCRWDELSTTEAISAVLAAILTGDLLVGTRKIAQDYFYIAHRATREAHDAIQLSNLDRQLLALLARGLTDQEIGSLVSRAPKTVGHRLDELRGKVGAKNRSHLVHLAHQLGLIDPLDGKSMI